ncbi:MAG TPA: sugar transferase [Candidatus Binatia bacterium]|nr:sugar transferase [Candidatus Binatia bacterium]
MLRRDRQLLTQISQLRDAALLAFALWVAYQFRAVWFVDWFPKGPTTEPFIEFAWFYLLVIPMGPIILEALGFYHRPLLAPRRQTIWIVLKGCSLLALAVIVAMFFFKKGGLSRAVIMLFWPISFGLVYLSDELTRWFYRSRYAQTQMNKRVVLIGAPPDTAKMKADLSTVGSGMEFVGELDINDTGVKELVALLHKASPNSVVINAKHTFFGQVEKAILACEREGIDAWLVADFFKTQISRTTLDDLHGRPVLVFRSTPDASWQGICKHVIDAVGSLVLLACTLPFMGLIALAIRMTSPGPVLFRQERCGLHGRPFVMLKFRSMETNAEQRQHELAALNEMGGPVFKLAKDPRITKVGAFLRKYSLDELPQLFNVLRGEMSLVGPRPLPVYEVEKFDDPAHRRRLSVKPGLTCLWQISGRNEVRDFRDWVRLDLEYIDNWSLWLDMKILMRTIPVVLSGAGAR